MAEVADRVLYGVGKFVENQSPSAHANRIIGLINRFIVPKLGPDQLDWVGRHKDAIETAAVVAGVGITTAEIVSAVVLTKNAANVFKNLLARQQSAGVSHMAPKNVEPKRVDYTRAMPKAMVDGIVDNLSKKMPQAADASPTVINRKWRPQGKIAARMYEKIQPFLQKIGIKITAPVEVTKPIHLEPFAKWLIGINKLYQEKWKNPVEAALLVGTLRIMLERLSIVGGNLADRNRFTKQLQLVEQEGTPKKMQKKMFEFFAPEFKSAFFEAAERYNRWITYSPMQKLLKERRAQEIYDKWMLMDNPGLYNVIAHVIDDPKRRDRIMRDLMFGRKFPGYQIDLSQESKIEPPRTNTPVFSFDQGKDAERRRNNQTLRDLARRNKTNNRGKGF